MHLKAASAIGIHEIGEYVAKTVCVLFSAFSLQYVARRSSLLILEVSEKFNTFKINSSNINEVISPVLNFFFFFYDQISQVQKSTKKHKKHQKALKTQPI